MRGTSSVGSCRREWATWESFVRDPAVRLLGLQCTTTEPDINPPVFEHGCGSSISMLSRRLRCLLPEPRPSAPTVRADGHYVRFQSSQERELTGATINQRVAIVDRALRITFPGAPGQIAPALQSTYWQRAPMGIGKPRPALSRLHALDGPRTD